LQLLSAKQDGVQEYVQLGAACELFMRYVTAYTPNIITGIVF